MSVRNTRAGKQRDNSISDNAIRVITINNNRFVVGLEWETIKAQRTVMKVVRQIGKERNLDVVAIRNADAIQAGFAPKSKKKLRGAYSLIVSLASLLEGCCIAVIPLGQNDKGEDEFTLVGRTGKGAIHPVSDTVYTESEVRQTVLDTKQELRGNQPHDIDIPVYGDVDRFPWISDQLDLNEILKPANIQKDFRLKPLRWGMTKPQLISVAVILAIISIMAYLTLNHFETQDRIRRAAVQSEMIKKAEIDKQARYQTALDNMKHPWISTSSVSTFLEGCQEGLKKLSLSIEGWEPTMAKCSQEGMSASYNRPDNSAVTTSSFIKTVRALYGENPDFNTTDTSVTAFGFSHTLKPNGDDPLQDMGVQLLNIISLFQSVNIPASFKEVAIKDVEKNEQGEDLPLQDWTEYTFDVETTTPPDLIFKNGEFDGLRIKEIIYVIGNGSLTYKISGVVYGKRKIKK